MKNFVFLICLILFLTGQVFAQEKKVNAPNEQIIVNRKYDENGNLIHYDSTYIHQWSSDSTLRFSFPNDNFFTENGFPDLNEFSRNFKSDPAFGDFPFSNNFNLFENDGVLKNFNFPDSMFINRYPFPNDSSMFLPFQHPGFGFQGFEDFQQFMNDQFQNSPLYNFQTPQFLNEKQREDWEILNKKHQLEIEELKKQWE